MIAAKIYFVRCLSGASTPNRTAHATGGGRGRNAQEQIVRYIYCLAYQLCNAYGVAVVKQSNNNEIKIKWSVK